MPAVSKGTHRGLPRASLFWTLVISLSSLSLATGLRAQSTERGMWLWESDTFELLDDVQARMQALAFLDRHRISLVFLYADSWRGRNPLVNEPEKYHDLVKTLRGHGLRVYALLGSAPLNTPTFIFPENRAKGVAMVQRVLAYNRASAPDERFQGMNLDIEPHLLPDWDRNRPERAVQYLELSKAIMDEVRRSGQDIPVGPAIPFWFDTVRNIPFGDMRRPLSEHTQMIYDYVALMDYRDTARGPDGIISQASNEVAYAGRIGKSVVIGVETIPLDLDKTTFFEEGVDAMEAELAVVVSQWEGQPSFEGIAIHHYGSLMRLEERGPAPHD